MLLEQSLACKVACLCGLRVDGSVVGMFFGVSSGSPEPGGPSIIRLWAPAAAMVIARFDILASHVAEVDVVLRESLVDFV